jgi:hypothetical protein
VGPGIAEGKAFKEDVSGVREVGSASRLYREAVSFNYPKTGSKP